MIRHPVRAVAAGLFLVGALSGFGWFHLHLTASYPTEEQVLNAAPVKIQLWFNEAPDLKLTRMVVTGPGDASLALGKVTADTNHSVVANLPDSLAQGSYTVRWQTASSDGHPIRGIFAFTYSTTLPASPGKPVGSSHSHH